MEISDLCDFCGGTQNAKMENTASDEVLRSREKLPNQTSMGKNVGSGLLGAGVQ